VAGTDGDFVDSTMAGFETDPFAESFDGFDPAATTFDDPTSAFGDGTELGHDVSAVNDDPYAQ
jgi:hypothetical protein